MKEQIGEESYKEFNDTYEKAAEKFRELGPLGVTAEDHRNIGSTPPDFMAQQPDKTMAELMTDEEIKKWFRKNSLNKPRDRKYLESIGRSIEQENK